MSGQVARTIVRHRYVRAGKRMQRRLWDALRYMEQRPLGRDEHPGDRQLFTAHAEGLARAEARALILEHASRRVAYHRLILSPGAPVSDLRHWTRLVLADLAHFRRQDLHWVAAIHRNTEHPHIHLLLAGTGAPLSGGGQALPVLLRRDDLACLREAGDRHGRDLVRADQALEQAIQAELDLLEGQGSPQAHALAEEGGPAYQYLRAAPKRHGPPGREATQGRE
jgi:hypothetical protein